MTYTTQWHTILDAEILAKRTRFAARLAAERARIAQERQAEIDWAIVEAREKRVLAGRWHGVVRELVEP